jgi:hypothetical protein
MANPIVLFATPPDVQNPQRLCDIINQYSTLPNSVTLVGDTNYAILKSDRIIEGNAPFTAPRTWTLPAVTAVSPGTIIKLFPSTLTPINTLTLARTGTDQLYDVQTGALTISIVITNSFTSFDAIAINENGTTYWFIVYGAYPQWIAYTPTVTAGGGTPVYTATGKYIQIGSVVHFTASVTVTNITGVTGAMFVTLPSASINGVAISSMDASGGLALFGSVNAGASSVGVLLYNSGTPWATHSYVFSGTYESG